MSRWSDNLQMYWLQALATPLFVYVVWRYVSLARWEAFLSEMGLAAAGYFCVIASDEVASWTGRYGWTYDSFWTYPPTYIRFFGCVPLIFVVLFGFR